MRVALARALATVGGLGDRLPAPGTTVGSLVAAVLFLILRLLGGELAALYAGALLIVLVPVAVHACGAEAARREASDPGAVVLDEVAGQWLALTVVAALAQRPLSVGGVALCFALFRLFDVVKPWPIGSLERLPGGWGIVADDLAAGLAAAVVQLLLPTVLTALR